jgi:hypothetical protein
VVIDGRAESLFAAEILLSRVDAHVAQEKLDLFQFSTGNMAEAGAGASQMPHAAFPKLCRIQNYAERSDGCTPGLPFRLVDSA